MSERVNKWVCMIEQSTDWGPSHGGELTSCPLESVTAGVSGASLGLTIRGPWEKAGQGTSPHSWGQMPTLLFLHFTVGAIATDAEAAISSRLVAFEVESTWAAPSSRPSCVFPGRNRTLHQAKSTVESVSLLLRRDDLT